MKDMEEQTKNQNAVIAAQMLVNHYQKLFDCDNVIDLEYSVNALLYAIQIVKGEQ